MRARRRTLDNGSSRGAGPVSGRIGRGVYALAKAARRRPGAGVGGADGTGGRVPVVGRSAVAGVVAGVLRRPGLDRGPKDGGTGRRLSRAYVVGTYLIEAGARRAVGTGCGGWGVVASAGANGFAVVTLVVTYVLQVVEAVTGARQLAGAAWGLGETPEAIVTGAWTGAGFDGLAQHLANLVPMVEAHGRRHEAYPALHFFQSRERRTSAPVMLAVLDEALLLLADGVDPGPD